MVPDGVLPWWLSAAGWVVAAALLALALWRLRRVPATRMVPLVGVTTAMMAVIMSVELVPIGYELHLTVLTGMIVGPWYGVIAALLFNVLRALIGDGAWTNIGLNTAIIWLEIALGAAIWAALRPLAQRRSAALAAGIATFAALMIATGVFVGVIRLSTVNPLELAETGAYDAQTGGLKEAAFAKGIVKVQGLQGSEGAAGGEQAAAAERVGFQRFAVAIFLLAAVGALIEAVVTGAITAFVARVRPDLIGLRPAAFAPDAGPARVPVTQTAR
jgi:ABC-type Co2+ transport system permease subunit